MQLDVISAAVRLELLQHKGKATGIHCAALAGRVHATPRDVRSAITALRLEGIAIAGKPDTGYFVAQTAEELNECCAFLRKRAMTSLVIESRLRKLALPELLGQMQLESQFLTTIP